MRYLILACVLALASSATAAPGTTISGGTGPNPPVPTNRSLNANHGLITNGGTQESVLAGVNAAALRGDIKALKTFMATDMVIEGKRGGDVRPKVLADLRTALGAKVIHFLVVKGVPTMSLSQKGVEVQFQERAGVWKWTALNLTAN